VHYIPVWDSRSSLGCLLCGAGLEDGLGDWLLAPPAQGQRLWVIQQQRLDEPKARKEVCEDDGRQPQRGDVGLHLGFLVLVVLLLLLYECTVGRKAAQTPTGQSAARVPLCRLAAH